MAFLENCVERVTGLAATCGWLALGGGAEAVVGVAIGGAGLAAVLSDAFRGHGPESKAALAKIRERIAGALLKQAEVERWEMREDLNAADIAMERALVGCFLDRKELAASARSSGGFPNAATRLILAKLAEREPDMFGVSGPPSAKQYAEFVVRTALEAAIENESYFRNVQPHLLMETLKGIGTIEERLGEVHDVVSKTHDLVVQLSARQSGATLEVLHIVGRVSQFIRHTLPERLCSPMAIQGTQKITLELTQDFQDLRKLKFHMTEEQGQRAESYIQRVVVGVNQLFAAIKAEAESTSPDMRRVNATLEYVAQSVDDEGRELRTLFSPGGFKSEAQHPVRSTPWPPS
jgi:hypothetical protein